jgi:hypothetical protein
LRISPIGWVARLILTARRGKCSTTSKATRCSGASIATRSLYLTKSRRLGQPQWRIGFHRIKSDR